MTRSMTSRWTPHGGSEVVSMELIRNLCDVGLLAVIIVGVAVWFIRKE